MNRLSKARAREAARVCLTHALDLIEAAGASLLSVDPGNLRIRDEFDRAQIHLDRVLFAVIDDQEGEK